MLTDVARCRQLASELHRRLGEQPPHDRIRLALLAALQDFLDPVVALEREAIQHEQEFPESATEFPFGHNRPTKKKEEDQ